VILEFGVGDKVEAQVGDHDWVPAEVVEVQSFDDYGKAIERPYRVLHEFGLQWCSPSEVREAPQGFITKDSGERAEFASGMVRDTDKGKARFDLLVADGVPYKHQFLTRCAELMMRGAEKYSDRNWEKANSAEEVARMKSSAFRHFMQWFCGETDEDHAAAVIFNILAAETTEWKIKNGV